SLLLAIFCAAPAFAVSGEEIVLAENGETDSCIVISSSASAAEKNAARILCEYLKKICSADFPTVTDDTAPCEKEIVVGVTNRDGEIGIDRAGYGDDGVRILTESKKLFLTGGIKSGAIYSVYTFLEDTLGCRWFTKDLTVIPEKNRLCIEPIDYSYVPCFRLRQTYWAFSTAYTEFCSAHKLHGVVAYVPDDMGGCGENYAVNSVHTLQWIITRDMFDEHPEYFGCDENGNRSPNRQPCLSNGDVLNLVVNYAENFFASYSNIFSVSQNDGMSFCQCDKCKAFNKAHGNTDSASMINFVNKVAEKVREEYPDARFETLAYQDSLTPPEGLEIADGIVIRMCPVNGCVLHDFDDPACKKNKAFNKAMQGWSKLTDNIYMWNYSTNFQYYYALFPNITTLQKRYQYFRDNNVVAVFDNGAGENMVPGEFHELKTYLVLKLLWNPDTDIERHISEFCDAYYGEAGKDVVQFINEFEKKVKGYNLLTFSTCHMTCQDGGESLENNTSLTGVEIRALDKIIKAAESRTLTADEARRLEGLCISWRFFKCGTFSGEYNWFSIKNDPEKEAEKLCADMRAYGIEFINEGGRIRIDGENPDFTVRPTWWFADKSEMPSSVKIQSAVLPKINMILRTIFRFLVK
ncbi:MAG: DUF4838 domain-containing protein, partial [Clostridia bacterium]|nr:DUF4838 domain-containing protein [Clostridia bacterium]